MRREAIAPEDLEAAIAMVSHTEKGLRYVSYAIILIMLLNVLFVVFLFALFPLIALVSTLDPNTIDPNDTALLTSILGAAFALLAAACAIVIIGLVGLILGIVGLVSLNRGKQEFGMEHAQRVDRAVIMVVLGFLVPIIAGVAIGVGAIVTATPGALEFSIGPAAGSIIVGVLATVLVGLFLLWSVETLSTPNLRRLGLYAITVGIIASMSGGALTLGLLATNPIPTTPQDFTLIWLVPGILTYSLSIVSLGLWYMAYRGVLGRFASSALRPMIPQPLYPPTPAYPPGYWPPAQQVPPPQQPPQEPPKTPGT